MTFLPIWAPVHHFWQLCSGRWDEGGVHSRKGDHKEHEWACGDLMPGMSIHLAPGDSTSKEFNCLACQPEIDSSLMFGKWDDLKPSSLPGTARAISGIGLYGEGRCQPLGWLPLLLQLCYWPHLWAETGTNANILPSQDPRTTFLVKVILFSRRVTCIHWLKCESETLEI